MLEVKLYDLGEGITEGEVLLYLVREGDYVTTDQPLVEVQTDKVVAELPSPSSGIVKKIAVPVGETVQVGTTLLYIEAEGQGTQPSRAKSSFQRVLATPYTRKIAREHQINLEDVPASDPSGRITEEDVYRYLKTLEVDNKESITQEIPSVEEIPFQGIRKRIAQNMSKSFYTIPHVSQFSEVDMTNLFKLREELKAANLSISVVAFLIKAVVLVLKDFPIFNAELDEENEKIILKREYHIGLATDTTEGLLVPVIHHTQHKSILEIHQEIKILTEKAQQGQLALADLQNSTFTVSNVGPLGGSLFATPIINYPQTALIAFHQTLKRPVVNEQDEIVVRQMMTLSFVFDHRVADGASAIAFINRLSALIEQPYKLMVEMI